MAACWPLRALPDSERTSWRAVCRLDITELTVELASDSQPRPSAALDAYCLARATLAFSCMMDEAAAGLSDGWFTRFPDPSCCSRVACWDSSTDRSCSSWLLMMVGV